LTCAKRATRITARGSDNADLIYGFDPNSSTAVVSSAGTTRVAAGLGQPVEKVVPPVVV